MMTSLHQAHCCAFLVVVFTLAGASLEGGIYKENPVLKWSEIVLLNSFQQSVLADTANENVAL